MRCVASCARPLLFDPTTQLHADAVDHFGHHFISMSVDQFKVMAESHIVAQLLQFDIRPLQHTDLLTGIVGFNQQLQRIKAGVFQSIAEQKPLRAGKRRDLWDEIP